MKDYILYQDTDSDFINIHQWVIDVLPMECLEKWKNMEHNDKLTYILKIAKILEKDINTRSYEETQRIDYNSQVSDDVFKITFKQELVAKTGIFIKKKKYIYHAISEEGVEVDEVVMKGVEIIRSDSPLIIKENMKTLAIDIIKGMDDESIINRIQEYTDLFYKSSPDELAENKAIRNVKKYIINGKCTKRTPYHVKAWLAYNVILSKIGVHHKYEEIIEGQKAKIIYLKPNKFEFSSIAFADVWPKELDDYVEVDYDKMIFNHFIKKLNILLEPLNKMHLLNKKKADFIDQYLI